MVDSMFNIKRVLKILIVIFLFIFFIVNLFLLEYVYGILKDLLYIINALILMFLIIYIIIKYLNKKYDNKSDLLQYIIAFMSIIVSAILIFISSFFPRPINAFLIIFVISFVPLTFIKICENYTKYGKKIFKFKTTLDYNELQLISKDIEKIDTYQKIIIKDNKIIIINKAGMFELILFNEKGIIKGNIQDENWYLNNEKINNPFTIKDEFKYNYFIVTGSCLYQTDAKLVTKSNIYYEISKYLNKEIYDNKKIDELYEVLNGNN